MKEPSVMAVLGPTSRPSDDIANGRVARELPVASALPIRQDLAQKQSFRNINLQIDMLCPNNVTILLVRPSLMLIVRV